MPQKGKTKSNPPHSRPPRDHGAYDRERVHLKTHIGAAPTLVNINEIAVVMPFVFFPPIPLRLRNRVAQAAEPRRPPRTAEERTVVVEERHAILLGALSSAASPPILIPTDRDPVRNTSAARVPEPVPDGGVHLGG